VLILAQVSWMNAGVLIPALVSWIDAGVLIPALVSWMDAAVLIAALASLILMPSYAEHYSYTWVNRPSSWIMQLF
jgi:hypothetical protein